MDSIVVVAAPLLVSWITGLVKNHALSSDASVALVRVVAAILSLLAALATMWLGGPTIDSALVTGVVLSILNFFGATGVYHLVNK